MEYNALDMHASALDKKLEQDINKAQKEVKVYVDTTFEYFQDLLNESLVKKWNQVMCKTCHTKGCMGHIGIRILNKK